MTGLRDHAALKHTHTARHQCALCHKGFQSVTPLQTQQLMHLGVSLKKIQFGQAFF